MLFFSQVRLAGLVVAAAAFAQSLSGELPTGYTGRSFADEVHQTGPQNIPGIVHCAWFDLGGEGVSYHDVDPVNRGSGELNLQPKHQCAHASPYIWQFRQHEGVDISYAKHGADLNHPNAVSPAAGQLYLGWAEDGEWCNYTVNVAAAGAYRIGMLYSNQANSVRFSINGRQAAVGRIPRATGGWHRWDFAQVGTITFTEPGLHVLTFHYGAGNNFAFLVFEPIDEPRPQTALSE
jgi:hypothetical protein